MKVAVEFMGSLRRPKNLERLTTIEIPEESTVRDFLKFLEYNLNEIRILQIFKKDGTRLSLKDFLQENDSLFLTIPVGGGD